jgi:quercetin dioxygenase-like cupin family protein
MKPIAAVAATILVICLGAAAQTPVAPASGIKRTILHRADIGDNMEVVLGIAEIAPGGATGRHTHFGTESGYVIEGSSSLEIEGEAPKLIKKGDSYFIPAGKIHDAKAVGEGTVKVVATYIVEKGKPFATPAH